MKKNSRKKMSLTTIYASTLGAFILGFIIVFISPMLTGGHFRYAEAETNKYMTLSNSLEIALVKKEYNPEKQIMRLDFSVQETDSDTPISDIKYEVESRYIKDKSKDLKTKITQLDNNYFVVIIKGIPEDFSVLSTTIVPKYVHPELQQFNDLKDRSIKIYINESKKIINNHLKIGNTKDYQLEYISYQQKGLKKEIDTNERQIRTNKLAIKELNKNINELESDMQYQTNDEKLETQNKINDYKTTIQNYKNDIEKNTQAIESLNKKIDLLNEKRDAL